MEELWSTLPLSIIHNTVPKNALLTQVHRNGDELLFISDLSFIVAK